MKRLSFYAMIALLTAPMLAPAAVGVSINVGQPGFYGQINLGDAPPPQVVLARPLWIQPSPTYVEPIYLRVRPEHIRHWRSYCRFYEACARPVYFVRDNWYDQVYVPYYRERYVYRDEHHEWKHRDRDDWNRGGHRDWDRGEHHGERGDWDHDQGHHGHGRD